jgi:hypothetical protein
MKRGFDSLSLVVEEEKHGMSVSIHTFSSLGGARPVPASMPGAGGMNGPQLAVGILGSRNTRLFRGLCLGNIPNQAGGFSCAILSDATLPKAVDWVPVPSSIKIADTVGNAVTFLRLALRQTTRTLFSFQGTVDRFSHRRPKVETARVETMRETRLTTATGSGVACGGFRSVKLCQYEVSLYVVLVR